MRLLILFILSPLFLFSQTLFVEHILAETQEWAQDVFATDIDGDGDLDLLGNENYGHILWFENTDGLGDFSEAITIVNLGYGVGDTFTADLDGDSDQDVIIARGGSILWLENIDGEGTFSTSTIIGTGWGGGSAYAADLDDDGDMDIIAGYYDDFFGSFLWYENDGFGNFSDGIAIGSDRWVTDVLAADIDSDGDLDLCTTSYFSAGPGGTSSYRVGWYENTNGLGTFSTQNIFSSGEFISRVKSTDLDGDGDADVLAKSGDKVIWFKNTDGFGTFSSAQIIGEVIGLSGIHPDDIDADGDMDVIASWNDGNSDGSIAWYENIDGLGNFGQEQTIVQDCGLCNNVYSGDFDGDTDIDVFVASYDKFTWYESSLVLGVVSFASIHFSIYPNPTKEQFTISLNESIELVRINIYNQLAQLISSTKVTTVNTSLLSSGMYYVEVITNQGKATKKLIIE